MRRDESPRTRPNRPNPNPLDAGGVPTRPKGLDPRYRIDGRLGHGGMGVVYRAWDEALDRPVAVKILTDGSEEARRRFEAEARLQARLDHPGIVRVLDAGFTDAGGYLVTELVEGATLRTLMDRAALDSRSILEILVALADAIAFVHEQGLVHRDLKPENVLIDRTGAVRICDFGIALERGAGSRLTAPSHVVGTLRYMSPEQLAGQTPDSPADLYALGLIGYELISGRLPEQDAASLSGLMTRMTQAPIQLPDRTGTVPAATRRVLLGCLAPQPASRPDSARLLARSLRADLSALEKRGGRAPAPLSPTRTMKSTRIHATRRMTRRPMPCPHLLAGATPALAPMIATVVLALVGNLIGFARGPLTPVRLVESPALERQGVAWVEPTPAAGTEVLACPRDARKIAARTSLRNRPPQARGRDAQDRSPQARARQAQDRPPQARGLRIPKGLLATIRARRKVVLGRAMTDPTPPPAAGRARMPRTAPGSRHSIRGLSVD